MFLRCLTTVPCFQYNLYVTADGLADEIMEKLAEKTGVSSKLIKLIDERKHKVRLVITDSRFDQPTGGLFVNLVHNDLTLSRQ